MAYGLEDLAPHINKLKEDQKVTVLDHLRLVQGIGVVMSELQADPKWAIYGNHAEFLKRRFKQTQDEAERALLDRKFMNAEEYGSRKIQQAENRGIVKGIQMMLDLAKELIEHGEDAAKIMVEMEEEKNT